MCRHRVLAGFSALIPSFLQEETTCDLFIPCQLVNRTWTPTSLFTRKSKPSLLKDPVAHQPDAVLLYVLASTSYRAHINTEMFSFFILYVKRVSNPPWHFCLGVPLNVSVKWTPVHRRELFGWIAGAKYAILNYSLNLRGMYPEWELNLVP